MRQVRLGHCEAAVAAPRLEDLQIRTLLRQHLVRARARARARAWSVAGTGAGVEAAGLGRRTRRARQEANAGPVTSLLMPQALPGVTGRRARWVASLQTVPVWARGLGMGRCAAGWVRVWGFLRVDDEVIGRGQGSVPEAVSNRARAPLPSVEDHCSRSTSAGQWREQTRNSFRHATARALSAVSPESSAWRFATCAPRHMAIFAGTRLVRGWAGSAEPRSKGPLAGSSW